jgi:undecaprenyl-diphosphatase
VSTLQSVILGALQGVAEFLPISSSGHLVLARSLLGLGGIPILYDVLLHVSTLVAVVVVFRRRIGGIFAALGRWVARTRREEDGENLRLLLYVVVGSAATAVLGYFFSRVEERVAANVDVVAVLFLVTAALLVATTFSRPWRDYRQMGIGAALLIGLAQGVGVLPGISRSGITIAVALFLGLQREKAGEFSFLLAVPAILGALLLQLRQAGQLLAEVRLGSLTAGAAVSLGVGLAALVLLLRLVRRGRLPWFAAYLVPLGLVSLILL